MSIEELNENGPTLVAGIGLGIILMKILFVIYDVIVGVL